MRSKDDILKMLDSLENHIADDFEAQDLDFKGWVERSINDNMNVAVKMAVCMANGGGGTVVFGIKDKIKGRSNAIIGVPPHIDALLMQKSVYEKTDPHITPTFNWIVVPEGHKRILMMNVYPGIPPYTETNGNATIRVGKECRPLTGSMRKELFASTGVSDFTSILVDEYWEDCFSPVAMERIRMIMAEEHAPDTLLKMSNEDLLRSIGALKDGKLTFGGLLIVGNSEALSKYIPNHRWDFRRMINSTDYAIKEGQNSSIPIGLYEIERYMAAENPTTTIKIGFLHPEFSAYPNIALREALLNAFVHRDYRIPGSVMLKHYKDKLIITNPGNFIGGISPSNILHHPPVARNLHLADLMDRLRLVNRSNLGVPRIYKSLLIEGKEPPQYNEIGECIELTLIASTIVPEFRSFIKELNIKGIEVDVDHLIILNYLLRHREIDTDNAAYICQRSMDQVREILSYMENSLKLVESGGTVKKKYYSLTRETYAMLERGIEYDRDKRLDRESIKMRILSILRERNLTNTEIRQMTGMDRQQVLRLMRELETNGVKIKGVGRGAYYTIDVPQQ
ncbi:transcriptional regulator [Alkaliphilus pronyensis]|uniref:Transcriptional regulator n=1 Tax=Alkaliphilus pronyensis TaxID=1482732 RepID=A0A6I0EWQ3_9FIRM|nr:RNA-binding domain-containing protein [Alkaliphilus pronyensis]KAB3530300.1 transcriptional regulator [Alkaliphilus pronyensis]